MENLVTNLEMYMNDCEQKDFKFCHIALMIFIASSISSLG